MTDTTSSTSEVLSTLAELFGRLSIYSPPGLDLEPEVTLTNWSVIRVKGNFDGDGDTIHLKGLDSYRQGRVCSPVKRFDYMNRTFVTRSGRTYKLEGPNGRSSDADYVWNQWIHANGNPECEDISSLVMTEFEKNVSAY